MKQSWKFFNESIKDIAENKTFIELEELERNNQIVTKNTINDFMKKHPLGDEELIEIYKNRLQNITHERFLLITQENEKRRPTTEVNLNVKIILSKVIKV